MRDCSDLLTIFYASRTARSRANNLPIPRSNLKRLHRLDLHGNALSDAGVKHLVTLTSLHKLDLSGARLTDEGLRQLAKVKSLRLLNLRGTKVTDAGKKEFSRALPNCELQL